jgi:hypothetical protein
VVILSLSAGACSDGDEHRGYVIDQDTNLGIPGAIVIARYMGGAAWSGSGCNRAETTVSAADGSFSFPLDDRAGKILPEAYVRGYGRGARTRKAYLANRWINQWKIVVLEWNEENTKSKIARVEPEVFYTEASAKRATGEDVNVYVRRFNHTVAQRLQQLHIIQADCAGGPKTTEGLAPALEAMLAEQVELGDSPSAIQLTKDSLKIAQIQGRSK